jgi:hypothetical protein
MDATPLIGILVWASLAAVILITGRMARRTRPPPFP